MVNRKLEQKESMLLMEFPELVQDIVRFFSNSRSVTGSYCQLVIVKMSLKYMG